MAEDVGALNQAKIKINELLEAAKKGTIVPIRLPNQIEEIANLIEAAEGEMQAATAHSAAADVPPDMEDFVEEEAHFIGHAVHELNTPLTSIRGYTDMLTSVGELSDMQKQFVDVVKTNSRRMEGLLSDFRYMNKIRHGVLKIEPKMDILPNIVKGVEKNVEKLADDLNREFIVDIPQGLPPLEVDSDHLRVAMTKLVENGLQYSPEETGKVTLSASSDDNKMLIITISDNGIGMTDEELDHLGELYFRGEDDRVREYKGSGLGIPIAYGMIDLIGGSIDVESTPGEGTTFTIRIKGMG